MALYHVLGKWAIRLRRLPWLHGPVRWLRRTFWRALTESWIQFGRYLWEDSADFGPPMKTFSVYQALRTGYPPVRGRIVLEDQGVPVVRHDSLMATGGYEQHSQQPWPIFWSYHARARLVSESLALLLDGKQLCLESAYGPHRLPHDPSSRFFRLPPPVYLAGNWTSIVSRWVPSKSSVDPDSYPNYTHWVLDALPRLALLSEFPSDTKILVPANLHRNQAECLAMLGLRERCRPTPEHHVQLENYYFSSPTTMLQSYNPYGIQFLRDAYLPHRDKSLTVGKRIFLRRIGLSREPQNIAEVEQLFEEMGWATLDTVKLTFAQQLQVFHEAEMIAGMFGSAFTNCVFCQKGCQVMSIMPTEFGLDGYLDWISQVVGFTWQPIVIPANYSFKFSVDLDLLRKWFKTLPPTRVTP